MPWMNKSSYVFTARSIQESAPARSGVYGLFSQHWIYIGEADDIRARLLQHLRGDDECIARYRPDGFVFETWPPSRRGERWDELVREFQPSCNRRPGGVPVSRPVFSEGESPRRDS